MIEILIVTIPATIAAIVTVYGVHVSKKHPAKIEEAIKSLLVPTHASVFDIGQEVFKARQEHSVLASKIDTVQAQITEVRADVASLSEQIQGTKVPSSRTTKRLIK